MEEIYCGFLLRFSTFLMMSIAYGLADPFALAGIMWHAAIGVGISLAWPDLKWWAALALSISVLMNLLFNRMMFAWLERLLAKRRTREIVTVLFIMMFVCIQFSGLILQRWGPALRRAVETSASVWRVLPPALAGTAIEHAADADSSAALTTTGLLALYALAFGGLFALRVHAQFTGEDLGESAAPVRRKPAAPHPTVAVPALVSATSNAASTTRPAFGLVSAPAAAVFSKEIRYFYRNSMLMMNVFMPLILIVFFSITMSRPGRHGAPPVFGKFSSAFGYPAAVAYIFMLIINFCPNNLTHERTEAWNATSLLL